MKKENLPIVITVLVVVYLFIVLVMLNVVGATSSEYSSVDGITAINDSVKNPFNLELIAKSFSYPDKLGQSLLIITFLYITSIGLFIYYDRLHKYGNLGTAKFETNVAKYTKEHSIQKPKEDKTDADFNIILGKGLKQGLIEGDNVNVLIIGGAGSGKSFGVIKPNILQMSTSYVVTDPSGEIFRALGKGLMEHGYTVKVFSTSDMEHSHVYNPFDYVYDEEGFVDETKVLSMVDMFQKNAADLKGKGGGDPFWDKSAKALLLACSMYLIEFCNEKDRNFYSLLKLVQAGKTNEDAGSSSQTALDSMFDAARKKDPTKHCFSSYDTFKLAPAKTANSILISAAVDLNFFNQTKVRNMTTTAYKVGKRNGKGQILSFVKEDGKLVRTDENIDLRTLGDEKTALFVNIPQANPTFNFLVSMMYSQLFETLYGRAEKLCPLKWMINDKLGHPVVSMLNSKEDAEKVKELYINAKVEPDYADENHEKISGWFIKNPDADKKYSLSGYPAGYLRKVYSEEVGKQIIKDVKENSSIEKGKGRLPWHLQCLLDEFANIGEIPAFPEKLATSRKYEISAMVVLQSKSQLENKYDKLHKDIMSNCTYTIFLGSDDIETCKYISERLGDTTTVVHTRGTGQGKGGGSNSSQKRALLDPAEISKIPKTESIVLANKTAFKIPKYNCATHPNFKYSGDNRKLKGYALNISEFVYCSEKSIEDNRSAPGTEKEAKNKTESKTPTGQKTYARHDMKNPDNVKNFFKMDRKETPAQKAYRVNRNAELEAKQETKLNDKGKPVPKTITQEINDEEFEMDIAEMGFPTNTEKK